MRVPRQTVVIVVVLVVLVAMATTQADNPARVFQTEIEELRGKVVVLEESNARLQQQLMAVLQGLEYETERLTSHAEDSAAHHVEVHIGDLERDVEEVQDLLAHFSRADDDIFITGANLHVVNGLGATDTVNGVGNVIIGYNEERPSGNLRVGSHVVVVGSQNNYSGFGGIVVGRSNDIRGDWSSVSGGAFNTAAGEGAAVCGGNRNSAMGPWSSVTGGLANHAAGEGAAVSGGGMNVATGRYSSVSGGMQNEAAGEVSMVSEGCDRRVTTCGGL